jgi:hypothetical protein
MISECIWLCLFDMLVNNGKSFWVVLILGEMKIVQLIDGRKK